MKITKQISDTEFVIEIDPEEIKERDHKTHMVVAHDYVKFVGTSYISTKHPLMIRTSGGGSINIVRIPVEVQIPIRTFVFGLLPELVRNEYCQTKHAETYRHYTHNATFWNENGEKMIVICAEGQDPHIMPYSIYEKIKTN